MSKTPFVSGGTVPDGLAFSLLSANREEELMTHFRHAAIVTAILASVGAAGAQTTVITREPVQSRTVVAT